ncbi:MAG: hypothetical protein M1833_003552 [Piccolia ochrophora]|nr:MAG: hypothetical protein M1833_003552 [Piccolia ochrophora]
MSYTDDAVLAKLSALNETQESIVTVAQWVIFHKRHADRTAQLWFSRLKDASAGKRLNLVYLANEVAQQSKARNKDHFLVAFAPIIAEATAVAYRGATNEIQQKLRRVVEVWRQRQIFELPVQEAVESRIDELDKTRSSGRKPLLGGSMLSGSSGAPPPEIQPLVPLQTAVSRLAAGKANALTTATDEYDKLTDPATPAPSPPVHAARLSGLLKSLANAEGAVAESVKARKALIETLEKLLESNRTSLSSEESQLFDLTSRKTSIEAKKREVEDGIMRGLAEEGSPQGNGSPVDVPLAGSTTPPEPPRPEVEALTPTGSPSPESSQTLPADKPHDPDLPPTTIPPLVPLGNDILSALSLPRGRPSSGSPVNGSAPKKRKLDEGEEFAAGLGGSDAMDGLDDDVAEMLRRESGAFT